ncbi:LacI family DNA-binding transcriptional regulator [Sphingobium aquiterrae]|uniref:LacI family DNA-binding transcriptional regulator n=1 Tax=Sphingobium aquiterrae TaxID=2038656 RepID=UPI00301A5132
MSDGKLPTIRDVAARAGVSVMTVSRVINHKSWVRPETRARVEKAVAELNYAPSAIARALAGSDDRRVALLYRNTTTSAYLGELLLGGLDEASNHHLHVLVEQCPVEASAQDIVARISRARVSGAILPPPLCDNVELIAALALNNIPAVAIAPDNADPALTAVAIDNRLAAHEMTRHLIDLGHRRIAFIKGHVQHKASARRLEGYRQAMTEHDLPADGAWVVEGDFTYRSGLEATERLLTLPSRPTAIFACNDDMAAAAITIAHQHQINVPAELTVCGFDDTPLASTIWPALTTIRQPIRDMGREAMALLALEIRRNKGATGHAAQKQAKMHYTLIRRQSDAVPQLHHRKGWEQA